MISNNQISRMKLQNRNA